MHSNKIVIIKSNKNKISSWSTPTTNRDNKYFVIDCGQNNVYHKSMRTRDGITVYEGLMTKFVIELLTIMNLRYGLRQKIILTII